MYIADQTLKEKKIRDELAANWNFEMENCKMTKLFTMSHTKCLHHSSLFSRHVKTQA